MGSDLRPNPACLGSAGDSCHKLPTLFTINLILEIGGFWPTPKPCKYSLDPRLLPSTFTKACPACCRCCSWPVMYTTSQILRIRDDDHCINGFHPNRWQLNTILARPAVHAWVHLTREGTGQHLRYANQGTTGVNCGTVLITRTSRPLKALRNSWRMP